MQKIEAFISRAAGQRRMQNSKQTNHLVFFMHFEIIGKIEEIEPIAKGGKIRDIMRLQKQYWSGSMEKA